MKHGLTLTSLMVAVALSGVLAVAGTRLVVNQMNTLRVMELKDKGDSIFEFYSNLLHDDKAWWCTLYDNILKPNPTLINNPNRPLRVCVLMGEECTSGTAMRLMGPDCRFTEEKHRYIFNLCNQGTISTRFTPHGEYRFRDRCLPLDKKTYVNSSVTFVPVAGKDLKDSVTQDASGGWWNVKVTWEHKGNSAVDIIFTQKFDQDKWRNTSAGKRYLPKLKMENEAEKVWRTLKVRRSANQVPVSADADERKKAITAIALHTAGRTVSRHSTPLVVNIPTAMNRSLAYCHDSPWGEGLTDEERARSNLEDQESYRREGLEGGVVQSNVACSAKASGRVAVTPKDCHEWPNRFGVIAKIGAGTASDNVKCALDGRGKMVLYSSTCHGRTVYQSDSCTVSGQTFDSSKSNVPVALAHVTNGGRLRCVGLPSWPARRQGPRGEKGYPGTGPRGPPGHDWNETCR